MASILGRYIVTFPATSMQVHDALQASVTDGSRTIEIELHDPENSDSLTAEFTISQSRPSSMHVEYIGTLADQGIASIIVMTHPDLSDTPARATLTRRPTTP